MPRRITIQPRLSLEELENRYRQAKDPVERSHYQIIWLLAQGRPSEEVASITGYSRSWIYELVWGYNRIGPDTLGDKRHEHPGAEPLLNEAQQALLRQVLQSPPADGGRWNGAKVADWMSEQLGRTVSRQRGWEYLKAMRYRWREKDGEPTEQAEPKKWKRSSAEDGEVRTSRPRRARLSNA
ncbi:MAG: helix-turn-helix domain-containing protein [Oculatellaceae cyanobacterium Prado106]|jgi:transposase|nr:helix-turn-helix domain-containing protein [Oculatellaceae cyanobacterium Prado106]